jgi:hypothetical protein
MCGVELHANIALGWGVDGTAVGGAIFHQGLSAQFRECRFTDNRAQVSSEAIRASAGALHIDVGAKAALLSCQLSYNAAGGRGKYMTDPGDFGDALLEQLASSAMHIYSKGHLVLQASDISDRLGQGVLGRYSMWVWVIIEGGSVALHDSHFVSELPLPPDPCRSHSDGECDVPSFCIIGDYADCNSTTSQERGYLYDPCPMSTDGICDLDFHCRRTGGDYLDCGTAAPADAGPFGKLLSVRSAEAEVLIRGCTVHNLTVASVVPLGVVNSTFEPPLDSGRVRNHSLRGCQRRAHNAHNPGQGVRQDRRAALRVAVDRRVRLSRVK